MGSKEQILKEYEDTLPLYNEFRGKIYLLLKDILESNNIPFQKIESRIKAEESLCSKIERKDKYSSLSDITDIAGFRIILFYTEDLDCVKSILESEFENDFKNFVDKRLMNYNEFGYSSVHIVLSLHRDRLKLLEYRKFDKLKFEVQIRTVLQHAWAEIEHDLSYKNRNKITDKFRRRFARIASLIELADDEFLRLKSDIQSIEKHSEKLIKSEGYALDRFNLLNLALNNDAIGRVIFRVSESTGFRIDNSLISQGMNGLFWRLFQSNYESIKQIAKAIEDAEDELEHFISFVLKDFYRKMPKMNVLLSNRMVLRYILIFEFATVRDESEFKAFCKMNEFSRKYINSLRKFQKSLEK